MNISKLYIMDDGSDPPVDPAALGVPLEAIDYHFYRPSEHVPAMQYKVYQDCRDLALRDGVTWMAFIDTDEFLDAPSPQTLRDVLSEFDSVYAVGKIVLNMLVHTSGGQLTRVDAVLPTYTEWSVQIPSDSQIYQT